MVTMEKPEASENSRKKKNLKINLLAQCQKILKSYDRLVFLLFFSMLTLKGKSVHILTQLQWSHKSEKIDLIIV